MPAVEHLFICLAHRLPMKAVSEAFAEADRGFANCAHGRRGSWRQVLMMDAETLESLRISPGAIRENIVIRGLAVQSLPMGQRLRIGEALLEVTIPCAPCKRMDDIRPGLQEELRGRRGMLCRVVECGAIRVGDSVELLAPVARN